MEFTTKKGLIISGMLCGLVAVMLAVFGNPANMAICVACFLRDTAGGLKLHAAENVQYVRPEIIGMVLGSLAIALISKEYRPTAGTSPVIRFVMGITIMIGALLFLGCPLRMVIRMSAGDVNAYIALGGFILGVGTGALALKKGYSLGKSYETNRVNGLLFPGILGFLFVLSLVTGLFAASTEGPGSLRAPVLIALGGGLLFGALAAKSRMCFAGSVRNILLMQNFELASTIGGLFLIMLVYNLASGNFHLSMAGQPIAHTEILWNVIGMYIVGLAGVLAGGCPLRQLILAGQGSADGALTVVGMIVGASICHNFGLASSGAGTTAAGRMAGIFCIVFLLAVGFGLRQRER